MNSALHTFAVAAVGGVLSALLTMFGTPRLQYRFWRYQRRTELQLEAIRDVTRIAAEFLTLALNVPPKPPSVELYQGFMRAESAVGMLFSSAARRDFMEIQAMVTPAGLPKTKSSDQFVAARDAALARLSAEAIPLPPRWLRWLW